MGDGGKNWKGQIGHLHLLLSGLSIREKHGREVDADTGFTLWLNLTRKLQKESGTIFLIGNGASASMASHMAADLAKNAKLHTEVFSDLSLITAISNDMGFDRVFVEPLCRRGTKGDMLVAISSSGRSPNVLSAVQAALDLSMTVVTLSGMNAENPLRAMGHINAYVKGQTYGLVESCHATILHHWMDLVAAESDDSSSGKDSLGGFHGLPSV